MAEEFEGQFETVKKHFNKDLIKRFANTYKFCDGDIKKYCLMLRKSVYPYEYMDSFNEKVLQQLKHRKSYKC